MTENVAQLYSYIILFSIDQQSRENRIFQCWNALDEITYRSVIMGTEHNNATELLGFVEEWVNSEPVLQVEKLGLWLSTKCPVQISSLSDPQCPQLQAASS